MFPMFLLFWDWVASSIGMTVIKNYENGAAKAFDFFGGDDVVSSSRRASVS